MKLRFFHKTICLGVSFCLIFTQPSFAQGVDELDVSGYFKQMQTHVPFGDKLRPPHLRYFSYDTATGDFRLILDKGAMKEMSEITAAEKTKTLLNYFLIGIALPNDSFWVNLRPDAADSIIDPELEKTDIGKIFLDTDLQLKKDTAQFTSPQTPEGKRYWDKLYKKAGELFGSENITIPTLTRPWIVPGEIIVREAENSAYIYKATLKVLLEEDYLKSFQLSDAPTAQAVGVQQYNFKDERLKELNEYSTQLIRELIIPKLTREVNASKRYAALRQVFFSLVLSRWFKERFRGKYGNYARRIDTQNLDDLASTEKWSKDSYFNEYKESFQHGEYNIKEAVTTPYGQAIRSYVSGGIALTGKAGSPVSLGGDRFRASHAVPPISEEKAFHFIGNGESGGNLERVAASALDGHYEALQRKQEVLEKAKGKLLQIVNDYNIDIDKEFQLPSLVEESLFTANNGVGFKKQPSLTRLLFSGLSPAENLPAFREWVLFYMSLTKTQAMLYEAGGSAKIKTLLSELAGIIQEIDAEDLKDFKAKSSGATLEFLAPFFDASIIGILYNMAERTDILNSVHQNMREKESVHENIIRWQEQGLLSKDKITFLIAELNKLYNDKAESVKDKSGVSLKDHSDFVGKLTAIAMAKLELELLSDKINSIGFSSSSIMKSNAPHKQLAQELRAVELPDGYKAGPIYEYIKKRINPEGKTNLLYYRFAGKINFGKDNFFLLTVSPYAEGSKYLLQLETQDRSIVNITVDNKNNIDVSYTSILDDVVDLSRLARDIVAVLKDGAQVSSPSVAMDIYPEGKGIPVIERFERFKQDIINWHKRIESVLKRYENDEYVQKLMRKPYYENMHFLVTYRKIYWFISSTMLEPLSGAKEPHLSALRSELDKIAQEIWRFPGYNAEIRSANKISEKLRSLYQEKTGQKIDDERETGKLGIIYNLAELLIYGYVYFQNILKDHYAKVRIMRGERTEENIGWLFEKEYREREFYSGDWEFLSFVNSCKELFETESIERLMSLFGQDKTSSSLQEAANFTDTSQGEDALGGIDFRAMNIVAQPAGSFSGLNFSLPVVSKETLENFDFDKELGQLQAMVKSGIIPSGQRLKEYLAACFQKGEIETKADALTVCLMDIFELQEEDVVESSPELREALVIVDTRRYARENIPTDALN